MKLAFDTPILLGKCSMGANSARQMEQASIKNSDNMSFIDDFRLLMEALI